jgi:V/A-type H+/Na+-transporting ATPase subunit E
MQQKIQELTERIFQEGVQKGEQKADEIIKAARERARKELADAREEAKRIVEDARKEAEELRRNIESEIRLSGQQALAAVKQSIVELVVARAVDDSVSATFSDPSFVSQLIKEMVARWDISSTQAASVEILLPESMRAQMDSAIRKDAASELGKGVAVKFSSAVRNGLQIGRADDGFKVSLTDEDFQEFIKEYIRPKTRAFLFGEPKA